jgi:hypothetical protein
MKRKNRRRVIYLTLVRAQGIATKLWELQGARAEEKQEQPGRLSIAGRAPPWLSRRRPLGDKRATEPTIRACQEEFWMIQRRCHPNRLCSSYHWPRRPKSPRDGRVRNGGSSARQICSAPQLWRVPMSIADSGNGHVWLKKMPSFPSHLDVR